MRKKIISSLAMIFIVMMFAIGASGCSGSSGDSKDDLTVETGRTVNEKMQYGESAAAVITNNGEKAVSSIELEIKALDKDDNMLMYNGMPATFRVKMPECIMPGQKYVYILTNSFPDMVDEIDHYSVEITSVKWTDPDDIEQPDIRVTDHSDPYDEYMDLTISNNSDIVFDIDDESSPDLLVVFIVARDKDGNIVGGIEAIGIDIDAHEEKSQTLWIGNDLEQMDWDKLEVYPHHAHYTEE